MSIDLIGITNFCLLSSLQKEIEKIVSTRASSCRKDAEPGAGEAGARHGAAGLGGNGTSAAGADAW